MKAHTSVARAMLETADTLFGIMGDANLPYLVDYIEFGGTHISSSAEGGAVSMADGFSRSRRQVGLASVTHGPAFTNSLTALVEAARSGSSLVLCTGETPAARPHHHQAIDIRSLTYPTGALYRHAARPEDVVREFRRAVRQSTLERLPVVLDLPYDVVLGDGVGAPEEAAGRTLGPGVPSEDDVDEVLGSLVSARRVVLLAGRGAVESDAGPAIARLAERVGAVLVTTVPAKDLFHGHPLDGGICGGLSTQTTTDILLRADLVLAFGASLTEQTTAEGSLLASARVIQCDIVAGRLGRFHMPDLGVEADARVLAEALLTRIDEAEIPAADTSSIVSQLGPDATTRTFADRSTGATVDARAAVRVLNGMLPERRAVVTDAGRFCGAPWTQLRVPDARDYFITNSFGSIGLGLATSIGVAAADRERLTVVMAGDSGGMMGVAELATAVRERLPLLVVVFDDGCYGAEYNRLRDLGLDVQLSMRAWPPMEEVAVGMGARGRRVSSLAELEQVDLAELAGPQGPGVLVLTTDPAVDAHGG